MSNGETLFSGKRSYEYLKHLAVKIGPRLTGSAGEHKAARYIEKEFEAFGLKTRLQRYPCVTFENRKCVFEVRERGKWRSVESEPVMRTPSTPTRGLEGEVYYAESGAPEYLSPEMKGKIVLVCGRISPDDRPRFLSYKPKALIYVEAGRGGEPKRTALRDGETYGSLPMARILHTDGSDIVKNGLSPARFTMLNTEKESYCLNVIGEKAGSDCPDEIVVICAHYDSCMGISGASDHAAGAAIVIELAHVFSKLPAKRTLRFIAFSGEETGLNGSTFYADDLARKAEREKKRASFNEKADKTELQKHRLSFNLDVHGAVLGQSHVMFSGPEDVGASARLLAREIGMACAVSQGPMSSDGTPLAAVGIPAFQYARAGGGGGHTSIDDIKNLSPDSLAKAGEFSELFLRRYVTRAAVFPFSREIPDDQMKKIKEYFTNAKLPVPGEKQQKKGKKKPRGRTGPSARKS